MKKIFALTLCIMLICATPVMAYAEESPSEPVTEEVVAESETQPEETVPDKIVNFIRENYEGSSFLSLAITIVVYTVFSIKKNKALNGTIGILNNNAIKVANDSTNTVIDVMGKAGEMAEVIKGYKEDFEAVITELRKNAEEKQSLEAMLSSVQKTIDTSKLAMKELADEMAELLVLANIPNSKKEELYARHRAAVDAIAMAEHTEVISNDGSEA